LNLVAAGGLLRDFSESLVADSEPKTMISASAWASDYFKHGSRTSLICDPFVFRTAKPHEAMTRQSRYAFISRSVYATPIYNSHVSSHLSAITLELRRPSFRCRLSLLVIVNRNTPNVHLAILLSTALVINPIHT
jgi:hypothetical protein